MDLAKYTDLLEGNRTLKELSRDEMIELIMLLQEADKREETRGHHNWFVPGTPYGIEKLPKHKAIMDALKDRREVLALGGNRCKVAGTKVWMADGSEKNIEDIEVGEKVLAFDIAANNLVESTVVDTFEGISDDVWWFQSDRNDNGFGATSDHKVLVKSPGKSPYKKELGKLKYYEPVIVPCQWVKEGTVPNFSEDVATLLGLLVGDGYLCAKDDSFKLTNKSEEILAFAEQAAEGMGLATRRYVYGNDWTDLYFTKGYNSNAKSNLAKLLIETGLYGTRSGTKFVPTAILDAPESYVRAFIKGLLAADGSYSAGRIDLWTTSEQLALTYQKALLRLGVPSSYSRKCHKNPNHKDCFRVTVSGDHYITKIGDSFQKKIILAVTKKNIAEYRSRCIKKKEKLPKQEIYCITLDHPDHLFVAEGFVTGNSGKTNLGAYISSVLATGQYPDWWEGVYFDHPVHIWAAGKTAQTTRDTVQKALMGDVGSFGTGMIPKDCVGQISTMKGTTHALESVLVKHVSGGWSSIGFKSYKQEVQSFFGTAKHFVWLDEPCPELIYNECLIRTAIVPGDERYEANDPRKGGRILHTITPKDGLTRLLADFLANCDLLAGTESLPGLDIAIALMDQQKKDRGEE